MKYVNLTSDKAFCHITNNLSNIFLTGPPGSGKSWLTKNFIDHYKKKFKNIAITASTGISSKLIDGTTLHSWSGIGIINKDDEFIDIYEKVKKNPKKVREWKKTDILVIDEISLIDVKTFDYLNNIGKKIRNNQSPFGGIKLLVVGDFYQLPPVVGKYCFKYNEWENLFDYGINLTENYRSKDNKLNKILKRIRKGKEISEKMIQVLEKRVKDIDHYPLLVPLRSMARKINENKMNENNNMEHIFKAKYYFNKEKEYMKDMILKNSPLEEELILKKGCPVINLVNDHKRKLMNGMVGIIVDFTYGLPIVNFEGNNYIMEEHIWEKKIGNETVRMEQLPLLLAYSITIHRSQGQTLSTASIILDHNIWEKGQGYVALSRLQSLKGLYLKKFSPDIFVCDKSVKKYYKKFIKK
jgi:ATP-dependent DNA helicase PIF1